MEETQSPTHSEQEQIVSQPDGADQSELIMEKYNSEFSPVDRRSSGQYGLFSGSEKIFSTVVPTTTHWSIAWSDLMMTMFVLFLSMFVYQAAHQDFLVSDEHGIIGGHTTEALDIATDTEPTLPFNPIKPGMPLATGGVVKKVTSTPIQEADTSSLFIEESPEDAFNRLKQDLEKELATIPETVGNKPLVLPEDKEQVTDTVESAQPIQETTKLMVVEQQVPAPQPEPEEDLIQPRPLMPTEPQIDIANQQINKIFTSGQTNLAENNLQKFASVQLIPDKTVRIVLTGDLLFDLGSAELSSSAMASLEKISSVIKDTPYMINVVGHTDNVPMHSGKFATNWELSVTRASTVARFLINEIGMNPNQFVVSGYSSYRPLKPNTNSSNRADNRRVEIIVSKRLPTPIPSEKLDQLN